MSSPGAASLFLRDPDFLSAGRQGFTRFLPAFLSHSAAAAAASAAPAKQGAPTE